MKPGFSIGADSQWNLLATSRELATYFSLEMAQKSQNLVMSVFCSNTLIFAPECWNALWEAQISKLDPLVTFSVDKSLL